MSKLSIKELKKKTDKIENYLDSHPAFDGMGNWPKPGHKEYWPVRWIMEYLHILKTEYYRKKYKKRK
ncbi:MAG: hypothetical protein AABX00_05870 [Nanoarchaeota archaeon]